MSHQGYTPAPLSLNGYRQREADQAKYRAQITTTLIRYTVDGQPVHVTAAALSGQQYKREAIVVALRTVMAATVHDLEWRIAAYRQVSLAEEVAAQCVALGLDPEALDEAGHKLYRLDVEVERVN